MVSNEKQACLVCKRKQGFKSYFILSSERKEFEDINFIYKECSFCEFGILDPLISQQEMSNIYNPEYFVELAQKVPSKLIQFLITIPLHESYIQFVKHFVTAGKILDIGCGNGEFLSSAEKQHFTPFGVEPFSKKDTKYIKKGTAEHIPYDDNFFDAVTMWHVFEHVIGIHNSVKEIKRVLKPGGYVIFEVPNAKSLCFRLFKNNYSWKMIPEHSLYFGEKNLRMLLHYHGFSIQQIEYPMKANLNFALSIKKSIKNSSLANLFFILTLPLSLIISFLGQFLGNGEVVRVAAIKSR